MSTVMDIHSLSHRQTWDLIPWVVNGSATAAECGQVEEHLRNCVDCRDEYAFQSLLHAGMTSNPKAELEPRPDLERLLARIDSDAEGDPALAATADATRQSSGWRRQPPGLRGKSRWMRYGTRALAAVIIGQAVGLVFLGALLLGHDRSPDSAARYVTLSQTSAAAGMATIRFVPEPTLSVAALQTILDDANVRIVESNRGSSIYGLAPDLDSQAAETADARTETATRTALAIARLRAQQGVLLVEPITSPAAGSR
ncbi:MAG: zf-HC2 domain-containing protein [Caldimonas sp.]